MSRTKAIASENQTKVCTRCGRDLPLSEYNKGNGKYDRRSICRDCEKEINKDPIRKARKNELKRIKRQSDKEYAKARNLTDCIRRHSNINSIKLAILRSAKQRAVKKGLEFNIDISDIELPELCPLLQIPMEMAWGKAKDNSYSLDRIDSSKGYIKGNVWVISRRANVIKNDASLDELKTLVRNLEAKIKG